MTTKKGPVVVQSDPDNVKTVILDRWPAENEKTSALRKKIKGIRGRRGPE